MDEVVRLLLSSSVVVSVITSRTDPKDEVLIPSVSLDGRWKKSSQSYDGLHSSSCGGGVVEENVSTATSSKLFSSLKEEEEQPNSLDSSMIVSVLAIRDFFVSMTELPKNFRTNRAAFSSGIPTSENYQRSLD
jgi:hypothetical protein